VPFGLLRVVHVVRANLEPRHSTLRHRRCETHSSITEERHIANNLDWPNNMGHWKVNTA